MSKLDVSSPCFNWGELGFSYRRTNSHIIYKFKDGKWDNGELVSEPYLPMHIAGNYLFILLFYCFMIIYIFY